MANRIKNISITDMRLDPSDAKICVTVSPESLTSTTQVRGRLMGPRCPYASTVEVAYPLRETNREYESTGIPGLTMAVIIPEPNFWEPETPFLYQIHLELWQKGERCDVREMRHALRTLQLGPHGLRLNSHPLSLRGLARNGCSEVEARSLHHDRWNTLLVPVGPDTVSLWEIGDRFGFLMLGRITDRAGMRQAHELSYHPSCLGWLLSEELLQDELVQAALPAYPAREGQLSGVEVTRAVSTVPAGVSFLTCNEKLMPSLGNIGLPIILWRKALAGSGHKRESEIKGPGILGVIEG
jgi:hypothetical protein